MCVEHRLTCGPGHSSPELLVSSELTNPLDMVDTGDTDALRHKGLRTTLSQIAMGTEAGTKVNMSETMMRGIAH